ncbi:MAG: DUF2490 domain-containing protein [Gammaproteobacteria bacterium]|nr:DUF2490 domain-containing protein [Gammaproteobacteria bacterium]
MFDKLYLKISSSLLLILAVSVLPLTVSAESRDSGLSWNLLLKSKINDDWFVLSRSNIASRNDNSDYFFGYTGVSLGYQLDKIWSLRLGYRYAAIKPQNNWLKENRPFLEAFASTKLNDYKLTSRSRLEWRKFDYRENDIRLRQEFTLEAPMQFTELELKPYLEEEIFYSNNHQRIEANWLGGGLAWRPEKGVKLKLGYRWNHFRLGNKWHNRDVIVIGLNLFY